MAAIAMAMIHIAASWPCEHSALPLRFPDIKKEIGSDANFVKRHWWQYNFHHKEMQSVTEEEIVEICELFYDVWFHSRTRMNIFSIQKYRKMKKILESCKAHTRFTAF